MIGQRKAAQDEGSQHRRSTTGIIADERGAVGIFFAITGFVLMFIVAVAVDYGRTELEYQRVQRAADAAALAASHRLGLPDEQESGNDVATRFFNANVAGRTGEALESVVLDPAKGEVRIKAGGSVLSTLLNAVGIGSMDVKVSSRVVKGDGTVEVALVLDNSGSMAGQPIADLKTAATSLTNVLFTGAAQSERVKIGVVPFSGAVNVGSANQGSGWIDTAGVSPLNGANFATNTPRLNVFSKLGIAWKGCVEARPSPYDANDAQPTSATPSTLFVPMFAPDEPDGNNDNGNNYTNNYIADDGGSCTPQPRVCTSYNRRGACTNWQVTPIPAAEAQARMCKYDNAPSLTGGTGPNYLCDTEAVLPLTDDKSEVEGKIASLVAKGYTNIPEGLMWGWRALSPEAPFTEGRPYSVTDNDKVIVLMTDGANTYQQASNHNKSYYGAQGYGAAGRLGTTYTNAGYVSRMNQKLTAACTNAKATGIKIYTVAFRLETDPATQALLQSCASEASMAYRASDGTALIAAFQRIGTEISKLRVSG